MPADVNASFGTAALATTWEEDEEFARIEVLAPLYAHQIAFQGPHQPIVQTTEARRAPVVPNSKSKWAQRLG